MANDTMPGVALLCDHEGIVLEVAHNTLKVAESDLAGKGFPVLVATSGFHKALSFLIELKTRHAAYDWEFHLTLGATITLVYCSGLRLDDRLLILLAETRPAVRLLADAIMQGDDVLAELARRAVAERPDSARPRLANEAELYDQMTAMNNELVTLQRDLARKNAELERLNAEVKRLAVMDDLTHLYNRRGFFELGRQELIRARRFGKPLGAILIDIDHFKRCNDSHGHAVGDAVLREVAARCNQQLREVDVIGRYGGEEFVILLPETGLTGAVITAERLRQHVAARPIPTECGPFHVTISLGVAELNGAMSDLEALLGPADQALYEAKAAGRNRVACAPGVPPQPAFPGAA